jgi:hypothetical protein
MVEKVGSLHLVLITGDLAFSGRQNEYGQVDEFVANLETLLAELGTEQPLIIPVPGNHDVSRPDQRTARSCKLYLDYDNSEDEDVADLQKQIWHERDASPVTPLFAEYMKWFKRRITPTLEQACVEVHHSFFPGDYSLIVEPEPGFKVGLVGLNTSWVQYKGGDFEGKLQLPIAQFHAALPESSGDQLEFFNRCNQALLLVHQPPTWLTKKARTEFDEEVYQPPNFAACLHGHLHEGCSETLQKFGSTRCYVQARSLCGLEHYGKADEQRTFGYFIGALSKQKELRVWPMTRVKRGAGQWAFDRDQRYECDDNGSVAVRIAEESLEGVAVEPTGEHVPHSWEKKYLRFRCPMWEHGSHGPLRAQSGGAKFLGHSSMSH